MALGVGVVVIDVLTCRTRRFIDRIKTQISHRGGRMIADFHFLRPLWLFAFLPLAILGWRLFRHKPTVHAWSAVCDSHLLPWLVQSNRRSRRTFPLLLLLTSALLMLISLAGPTWSRLPVPTYQQIQPRVLVLDMTPSMSTPRCRTIWLSGLFWRSFRSIPSHR